MIFPAIDPITWLVKAGASAVANVPDMVNAMNQAGAGFPLIEHEAPEVGDGTSVAWTVDRAGMINTFYPATWFYVDAVGSSTIISRVYVNNILKYTNVNWIVDGVYDNTPTVLPEEVPFLAGDRLEVSQELTEYVSRSPVNDQWNYYPNNYLFAQGALDAFHNPQGMAYFSVTGPQGRVVTSYPAILLRMI